MDWISHLLQTSDTFFPTGSYAHSFGLEGLIQAGVVADRAGFHAFLNDSAIPSLTHVELPLVHLAHGANVEAALRLGRLGDALRSARELREASVRIGSQRLNMVADLTRDPLLEALRQRADFRPHAPVVFGVECGVTGVPVQAAMAAYFYQSLVALTSAAMKLVRMGQVAAQEEMRGALNRSEEMVAAAMEIEESEIGWFSPLTDIASARHQTAYTRLFIS